MLLDGKVKRVALLAAVDICLRNMHHSPKRCARNLIELGTSAFPDKLTVTERSELYHKLLRSFESEDLAAAKALFTLAYL